MTDWTTLAAGLTDELVRLGKVRSPQWQAAVRAVPRHELVPVQHLYDPSTGTWTPRSTVDDLALVYSNTALFLLPGRRSSTSMPGLLTRMLETLSRGVSTLSPLARRCRSSARNGPGGAPWPPCRRTASVRGVTRLLMEAREQELNERDVRTVTGARLLLPRAASSALTTSSGCGIRRCWPQISSPGRPRGTVSATRPIGNCSPTVSSRPRSSRAG